MTATREIVSMKSKLKSEVERRRTFASSATLMPEKQQMEAIARA